MTFDINEEIEELKRENPICLNCGGDLFIENVKQKHIVCMKCGKTAYDYFS